MKRFYYTCLFIIGILFSPVNSLEAQENSIPQLQVFVYGVPPYTSGYEGKITGPTVEEVTAYLDGTGLDYKMDNLPWTAAYQRTLQRPNTILFPLDRTESRENQFLWIKPLIRQEYFLYTRNVEGLKNLTLEDILAGDHTFTCGKNTIQCIMLEEIGIPKDRIFAENSLAIRARYNLMVKGDMNFTIFDPLVYEAILNRYGLETKALTPLFKLGERIGFLGANKDTDPRILERLKSNN